MGGGKPGEDAIEEAIFTRDSILFLIPDYLLNHPRSDGCIRVRNFRRVGWWNLGEFGEIDRGGLRVSVREELVSCGFAEFRARSFTVNGSIAGGFGKFEEVGLFWIGWIIFHV